MSYELIDAPVGPFSTPEEIRNWIYELQEMDQNEQVKNALADAIAMLEKREAKLNETGI